VVGELEPQLARLDRRKVDEVADQALHAAHGALIFREIVAPSRRTAVAMLGALTAVRSLAIVYLSRDLVALATLVEWVGTNLIVVLALCQVVLFAWAFGAECGFRFARHGAARRLPRVSCSQSST
jgi:SNF family Na+-dependent transporter